MIIGLPSLLIALALPHGVSEKCEGVPTTNAVRAVANDNRVPAGELKDGTLTLRLTMREAGWYPDGPQGCGLRVHTFAEDGKPPSIPGPLIRVKVGTEVRVILRNDLGESVRIRGLVERPVEWRTLGSAMAQLAMDSSAIEIAKGEVREIRFRTTVPGNFYYWGRRTAGDTAWQRRPGRLRPDLASDEDGQLVGALIVDPPGTPANDRVFVLTHTRYPGTRSTDQPDRAREVNGINGLSWPYTERISATVGDTLQWRVLNPANTSHVMHLHGFYYRILQHGGVSAYDSVLTPAEQEKVVSEFMAPNRTMTISWIPERAGNWLFHCHFLVHMSAAQRVAHAFGDSLARESAAHADHAEDAMAGPIIGISVRPRGTQLARGGVTPRRRLRLFADERARVFGDRPGLGFVLQSGESPPRADSIQIPGTPIILTRGEPTQITVINRLRVGLGVHWHGVEVDSYFDGVPGVSGSPARLAPLIQPGDSFVVRITPPHAGTFMYHTHSERFDELISGLYGPLIVVEPGQAWTPDKDHLLVLSNSGPGDSHSTIFVNGSATPAPIEMEQGVPQRLRFMSIPANGEFSVRLLNGTELVTWRQIARDGANLSPSRIVDNRAQTRVDVGITKDFVFSPDMAGDLVLEVDLRVGGHPTKVPIRVR
jgi:FtsP/CotA-like multicopper oxidase with cupredoxin domain